VTGLRAFLRFEVLRLLRNVRYVGISLGFPVVFYMLFLHNEHPTAHIAGTTWRTYFMVSMASFGAMVASLNAGGTRLAAERASGWTRQLRVTPLPPWSYVATKIAASMVIALPVILVVELTGLVLGGVRLGLGTWTALTVVLWASAVPFAALGALVGFVASSDLPVVLRHVAAFLPSYRDASVGWAVVAGRAPGLGDGGILLGYAVLLGLVVTWRHRVEESRAFA
jgi:ABC-2 type transport system permease protein